MHWGGSFEYEYMRKGEVAAEDKVGHMISKFVETLCVSVSV